MIPSDLVIEDWYLQAQDDFTVSMKTDAVTSEMYCDDTKGQGHYRLVGTKEQIDEWSKRQTFQLDEVYAYTPIEKGSYWDGIVCGDGTGKPTLAEYNNKWRQDFDKYTEMYKQNSEKLLVM